MEQVIQPVDYCNRISVFRHLTTDKLSNSINEDIFRGLLDEYYNDFIEICIYAKENASKIKYVSCYIENGAISFDIDYI